MRLVADCGNTQVKLGVFVEGRLQVDARLMPACKPTREALDAFCASWLGRISELVLLPGAAASAAVVRAWWNDAGGGRPLRVIGGSADLDLPLPDLGQYPGCGIDRVLAGFSAGASERRSLVVIDAGTATTITAWQVRSDIPDPQAAIRFAGGLILPSAHACLKGLALCAPALPLVEPDSPDASARQRDTSGAIAAAIGIGYGPMVAACLLKLQRESNIHDEVLTGGSADQLIAARAVHLRNLRPHLVLEGIDRWCRYVDR